MFGDIGKLLQLAGKLKTELPAMKERLASASYSASSGGGAVSATVNGKMELVDLAIAPELLAAGDVVMLQDLIKAAVTAVQDRAGEAAKAAMNELTGGMELPGLTD